MDYLKIDGTFVQKIAEDQISLAIVRSINDIGKVMGKKTIAEHVENDQIYGTLKAVGVDPVDSYLCRVKTLGTAVAISVSHQNWNGRL